MGQCPSSYVGLRSSASPHLVDLPSLTPLSRGVGASSPLIVPANRAGDYLRRLGISTQTAYKGVERGDLRPADVDAFHPRGTAGVTRLIRNMVDGREWQQLDKLNRPTVERADGKVSLSVVGCRLRTTPRTPGGWFLIPTSLSRPTAECRSFLVVLRRKAWR